MIVFKVVDDCRSEFEINVSIEYIHELLVKISVELDKILSVFKSIELREDVAKFEGIWYYNN